MAPSYLFDISGIDLNHLQYGVEEIEQVNPHRGAMRMLDGVVWFTPDFSRGVAFKDVRADEFWVAGHIPGRPLFPGVLMIETAAQLASFATLKKSKAKFMGFVGLDAVKFRGQVVPGDRLFVLAEQIDYRPRRSVCQCQGWVCDRLIFECKITGMPI